MASSEQFAATLIRNGSRAFAGYAASLLEERHPDVVAHFGESGFTRWRENFSQQLDELAAALEVHHPSLFVSRIAWARSAFALREVPADDLRYALETLREILEQELPDGASAEATRYVTEALGSLDTPLKIERGLNTDGPAGVLTIRYLEAVLTGDRRRAIDLITESIGDDLSLEDVYLSVLLPAQAEIGRMWHAAQIGIAEEHVATATTQAAIAVLAHADPPPPHNGKRVALASAEGNAHDMALRVLAALFERDGWRAYMLGADLPVADLAEGAGIFEAHAVVLSATLSTQLRAVRTAIEMLRATRPSAKLIVGGLVFDNAPGLGEQLGADAAAVSPLEAIDAANKLVDAG